MDLSSEALQVRRQWSIIIKILKQNNCQLRILYPESIVIKNGLVVDRD